MDRSYLAACEPAHYELRKMNVIYKIRYPNGKINGAGVKS